MKILQHEVSWLHPDKKFCDSPTDLRPSEYGRSVDRQKADGDKTLSAFLFSCEQETSISLRLPDFNLRAVLGGLCNVRVLGMCTAHSLETSEDPPHFPFFQWGVWGDFGTF